MVSVLTSVSYACLVSFESCDSSPIFFIMTVVITIITRLVLRQCFAHFLVYLPGLAERNDSLSVTSLYHNVLSCTYFALRLLYLIGKFSKETSSTSWRMSEYLRQLSWNHAKSGAQTLISFVSCLVSCSLCLAYPGHYWQRVCFTIQRQFLFLLSEPKLLRQYESVRLTMLECLV